MGLDVDITPLRTFFFFHFSSSDYGIHEAEAKRPVQGNGGLWADHSIALPQSHLPSRIVWANLLELQPHKGRMAG